MKPSPSARARRRPTHALVAPDLTLGDLIGDLAARLSPDQRGAFLAKMAAMDRANGLTAAMVTLGRA